MSVPLDQEQSVRIADNLEAIQQRVAKAALRAGREAKGVSLTAVSKIHSADSVRAALETGHRVYGENRVQEAAQKWPPLKADFPDASIHLIGPLQTNKVRDAVALFDVIETVDRPKLAAAIAEEMEKQSRHLPCFIQINTGEESQKAGVMPAESDNFIAECRNNYGLNVSGLMCIPPQDEEPALHFAFLREIANRNGVAGLSMGMSADFETAVELGATHIRLGRAVFGERPIVS
ncbi:MAG: YggS family pyridoxal phosphate-dependent enzyme [Rhodospirillaceae bacterium]|nr:YggS family pyridoxal phosphate-dependent enzyme [Rhodospirillaceae bacterium]